MKVLLDDEGYVQQFLMVESEDDTVEIAFASEVNGSVSEVPTPKTEAFFTNYPCYRLINGKLQYQAERAALLQQRAQEQEEAKNIQAWFLWYDNQCKQYHRAMRLGEPYDQSIEALDTQAKVYQLRLREIQETGTL